MVPQLRFPGYSGEWEEKKLGEVLDVMKSGLSRMLNTVDIGLPVVRANNVNDGKLNLDDDIKYWYLDDPQGANTANYLIHKNDILINFINSEAKMGTAAIVEKEPDRDTIYTTNILKLQVNNQHDPKFIFYQSFRQKYQNYVKSITKPAVNQASFTTVDFKKYEFLVPNLKEQQKIGSFFTQLDDLIALHQQKLTHLQERKKGLLQKMFPKAGEKVPELRFPGFNGDWEEKKLGEVANIIGGGTPKTDNIKYWNGEIDWYSPAEIGQQIYVDHSQKKITELGLKKSSAKILPIGTVLFTSRAGIGSTAILAKEATTNQGFQSIVPIENRLDSYFIYSCTNILKRFGETKGAGSTFIEISGKQMAQMHILLPTIEEQKKIGTFFKQIDNSILLQQQKLDNLKERKKALLQQMFV
jgi:type I restriction enzyme S subunit